MTAPCRPSPTARDTRDLLSLACTLRDRGRDLLARPDSLRSRAQTQLVALHEQQIREGPLRLDLGSAQADLLATLSMLRRAVDAAAGLQPRIDALTDEIDELVAMAGPAARPLRMLLSARSSKDSAQVAATHLRRFMLSLDTLRLAGEIRRRCAELDAWQPDAQSLWRDYAAHAASYHALLVGLTPRASAEPL